MVKIWDNNNIWVKNESIFPKGDHDIFKNLFSIDKKEPESESALHSGKNSLERQGIKKASASPLYAKIVLERANQPIWDEDDDESDFAMSILQKLKIKPDDIYDYGFAIGLTASEISENFSTLLHAFLLRTVTDGKLSDEDLVELQKATIYNDHSMIANTLKKREIRLENDIDLTDMIFLLKNAQSKLFRMIYAA